MSNAFTSPTAPRRPQTASADRLGGVRASIAALGQTIHGVQSYAIGAVAAPSPSVLELQHLGGSTPPPPTSFNRQLQHQQQQPNSSRSGKSNAAASGVVSAKSAAATSIGDWTRQAFGSPVAASSTGGGAVAQATTPNGGNTSMSSVLVVQEDKLTALRQHALKIEQHIAVEVKRRADSDKQLQLLIDARAKEIASVIERKANEKLIQLHISVDTMTKRVEKLTHELAVEREKNVRLTQELKSQASTGLEDVKDGLATERSNRVEKEAQLYKKLADEAARLHERLDVERHARETLVRSVRDEIAKTSKAREKSDIKVLQQAREDVATLKRQLKGEREQRERGEEQLAAAMEEVVNQVQVALRSIAA